MDLHINEKMSAFQGDLARLERLAAAVGMSPEQLREHLDAVRLPDGVELTIVDDEHGFSLAIETSPEAAAKWERQLIAALPVLGMLAPMASGMMRGAVPAGDE